MSDERERELLAERLRTLAERRGWSMVALATRAGIGRTTLQQVLARQQSPTVKVLSKLAGALGVTVADLLSQPPVFETAPTVVRQPKRAKKKRPLVKRPSHRGAARKHRLDRSHFASYVSGMSPVPAVTIRAPGLTVAQRTRLAETAFADERTIANLYLGRGAGAKTAARIIAAARSLGLPLPPPAAPAGGRRHRRLRKRHR